VSEDHPEHGAAPGSFWRLRNTRLAVAAGIALGAGLVAEHLLHLVSPSIALYLAGVVLGGATFVPDALRGLLHREVGVGTLMTIAAIGAVLLGEYGEAASLAFLFSLAEALESYSLTQARQGLRSLLALVPDTAQLLRDGVATTVLAAEIRVGDTIRLRAGERLATDAVVRSGTSALDVSAITGESIPVEVGPGSAAFAGSVNGRGVLDLEATAVTSDNSLARMVHVVEEAQDRKGASQRLADRVARPLVPGIIVVAAATAVIGTIVEGPDIWIPRALVMLVAAAPCAFAIAVPVTVVAAIGAATRMGILIKGGAALEALGHVRTVALDKTGTLTRNEARIVDVVPAVGVDASRVVGVAAALEAQSDHPLSAAIVASAPAFPPATDVVAVPGEGLTGIVEGRPARVGRPGFVGVGDFASHVAQAEEAGSTVVAVGYDGRLLGLIAVRDDLRAGARVAVAQLRASGYGVVMLTGDNPRTARAVAAAAGIQRVEAGLRPTDKADRIETLRASGPVAMVGDGINDAPALATADVGIAMGAMGSDIAIEAADVALMGDDLQALRPMFAHARRSGTIMRQNLFLAGAILVVLIPAAALGTMGLAAVVLTHELAEVIVIANGLRGGRRPADHEWTTA
jgi:cation-transporting ATPase G